MQHVIFHHGKQIAFLNYNRITCSKVLYVKIHCILLIRYMEVTLWEGVNKVIIDLKMGLSTIEHQINMQTKTLRFTWYYKILFTCQLTVCLKSICGLGTLNYCSTSTDALDTNVSSASALVVQ